ncbi:hypothetical protein BE08_13300 [Sorangium cellulosum]|uniref:Uncharacterized protein n=1 Tax=Sorangium cellulosum TaxID=56 RepID=A0A150PHZ6_SORCE|nr:hypothetical protein BE08_13300 [Sorangium cellulosum]
MSESAAIGIAVLFAVSLLVRVAPSLIRPPLRADLMARVEAVVPVAVLLNLAAFCAFSEIKGRALPASAGLAALLALLLVRPRLPLVLLIALASAAYIGAATLHPAALP